MPRRPFRRVLASALAALLSIVGFVGPSSALAKPLGPGRDGSRMVRRIAPSTWTPRWTTPRAVTVDRRVSDRLERVGAVDALLILDGSRALDRALPAAREHGSRALLRSVVPSYRDLKEGVRSRMPTVEVLRDYRTLPILFVRLSSRGALDRAAADPAVVGIAANRERHALLSESLTLIDQPEAEAAGHLGTGTSVAVLDTGVDYTRSAFGSCPAPGSSGCRVVIARDFAPEDGIRDDAVLHGTNVAGIVAGVAPETGILALDVFSGDAAFDADILEAIDFSIANQAALGVRAINLSLGDVSYHTAPCGGAGNPFVSAFSNARAAGIVPVVASGNAAFNDGAFHVGVGAPACVPGAVSVGAVYDANVGGVAWGQPPDDDCADSSTAADRVTCFSQAADFLTVLAPGAMITAADVVHGGTSQAAPHVAGAVAVLSASRPGATPSMIESAIGSSGPLVNDPLMDLGFHRLDLPDSIATLASLPEPADCTIFGDARANVLEGTPGDDVICADAGDDVVLPGGGNDVVMGGRGFDFISFEGATGGAVVDLSIGSASAPGITLTMAEIEGVIGSRFSDTIVGDARENELLGLGGRDRIEGGAGFDFARYDFAGRRILASLVEGLARGEGTDRLSSIEGLVGSPFSDELAGDNGANVIDGAAGDDVLPGLGGSDQVLGGRGADVLFGERGNDDLLGGPGRDVCDQGPGRGARRSCEERAGPA